MAKQDLRQERIWDESLAEEEAYLVTDLRKPAMKAVERAENAVANAKERLVEAREMLEKIERIGEIAASKTPDPQLRGEPHRAMQVEDASQAIAAARAMPDPDDLPAMPDQIEPMMASDEGELDPYLDQAVSADQVVDDDG